MCMAQCMRVSDLGDFYGDEHDTGVVVRERKMEMDRGRLGIGRIVSMHGYEIIKVEW